MPLRVATVATMIQAERASGAARTPWLILALLLALATAAYWPVLAGSYILDDWPTLAGLADVRDGDAARFGRYVVEGYAGPTGRPLALLSFALQAESWPGDAWAFHAVNLALHLACGIALALFGRALARRWWPGQPATADLIAVVAVGLWLVHPLNVSTTAYVVQRMTQLATLFTLLALLAWTHGRLRAERAPHGRDGRALAAFGLVAGGIAAVLSKETGVLLLAYALVLEHWVFDRAAEPPDWRRWRALLLTAPALAFLALVAWRFDDLTARAFAVRDFTLLERLASEPRALLAYLKLLVAPLPSELTLFNDGFAVSRGPFAPVTTLPAIVVVLGAAALAFAWRRRAAPLAFAIAWFLAGHLLESTVLPLELYFEHRNYLPMAGPLLALAHYGAVLVERLPTERARRLVLGGAVAVVLVFAAITWSEARLWSDPERLTATWAAEHPESARAQGTVLALRKARGELEAVAQGYREMTARFPDDPSFWLDWAELGCLDPHLDRPAPAQAAAALAVARPDYSSIAASGRMVQRFERDGACGALPALELAAYLGALLANPRYGAFEPQLRLLRARLAATVGDHAGADADFDRAWALRPGTDVALMRFYGALRGGEAERIRLTFHDLDARVAHDRWRGRFYRAELESWRARLRAAGVPLDAPSGP
jgi:hypothetical protein